LLGGADETLWRYAAVLAWALNAMVSVNPLRRWGAVGLLQEGAFDGVKRGADAANPIEPLLPLLLRVSDFSA
jgi:hypothetical protein